MKEIALCFDYYGTLVDIGSPFSELKTMIQAYLNEKKFPAQQEFLRCFMKYRILAESSLQFLTGKEIFIQALQRTCSKFGIECFENELLLFLEEIFGTPKAFGDAKEVVRELSNYYTVGILSNADNNFIHSSIQEQGFCFDFIVTSEDARSNKPDKEIFLYTMKKLKRSNKHIYMIGDSQNADICGAGWLGIPTVWVNKREEILHEGSVIPDYTINNLSELLSIFLKNE